MRTSDKLLFTPGPLTTSEAVKQAMLHDLGSRDDTFIELIQRIRRRLLHLGGVDDGTYEAVLMQGSGTFVVESPTGPQTYTVVACNRDRSHDRPRGAADCPDSDRRHTRT